MSRRAVYGSLEDSGQPLSAARTRGPCGEPFDSSCKFGSSDISIPYAAGNFISPSSGGGAGRRKSWWQAGIIMITAATAVATVLGLAHLADFAGTLQRPAEKNLAKVSSGDPAVTAPLPGNFYETDVNDGASPWRQPATVRQNNNYVSRREVTKDAEQPDIVVNDAAQNAENGELAFVALNDYTRRGDVVGVGYPWLEGRILVEPYRETSLEVVEPREGMVYYWSIVETHSPNVGLGEFTGDKVTCVFTTASEYTVALLEIHAEDNQLSRMLTVDIFCKYVRREIRSLFEGERDELFDAMKVW